MGFDLLLVRILLGECELCGADGDYVAQADSDDAGEYRDHIVLCDTC